METAWNHHNIKKKKATARKLQGIGEKFSVEPKRKLRQFEFHFRAKEFWETVYQVYWIAR